MGKSGIKLQNIIGDGCKIHKSCSLQNCKIGNNVQILNSCKLINCQIKDNVVIDTNSYLINSVIEENTKIMSSVIENSIVGKMCNVGPFSHIRENSTIKNDCRVGNFVEIKNSTIGNETKIAHLAYVGDATVGEKCNIGCGVVFVNYNGKIKQKTIVKNNCFIGCNCNLIAPVVIESNSYICAGTTVTEDVNSLDFVIGRVKQQVKPNLAKRYLKEVVDD